MARPMKNGLLYFPFDTDFFYADRRIKALRARYGSDGILLFIYLLAEIYRNGYFVNWDEDAVDNAVVDLGLTDGLIEQIMTFLVGRSLLFRVKSKLAGSDTIITSPGIQKRYQLAAKALRRDVFVDRDIWLLEEKETAAFIKFAQNFDKSEKNKKESGKKENKSGENRRNKKEIEIEKETKKETARVCVRRFEDFQDAYPKTVFNRQAAEYAYCKILLETPQIDEEDLVEAARNYAEAVSILGYTDRYVRAPENFLKDNFFVAYLRGHYQKPPNREGTAAGKKNAFNSFQQNTYDFDELERSLLQN